MMWSAAAVISGPMPSPSSTSNLIGTDCVLMFRDFHRSSDDETVKWSDGVLRRPAENLPPRRAFLKVHRMSCVVNLPCRYPDCNLEPDHCSVVNSSKLRIEAEPINW